MGEVWPLSTSSPLPGGWRLLFPAFHSRFLSTRKGSWTPHLFPKRNRHRPCTGTHRLARHVHLNACFLGKFLQALPKWVRYRPQRGPDNMPQVPGFPGRWSCSKSSGLYRSPAKMCNFPESRSIHRQLQPFNMLRPFSTKHCYGPGWVKYPFSR